MKTGYRGYIIELTATQKNGPWTVTISIQPIIETHTALHEMGELAGYNSQIEAEDAGLRWAKEQINANAENRRPIH